MTEEGQAGNQSKRDKIGAHTNGGMIEAIEVIGTTVIRHSDRGKESSAKDGLMMLQFGLAPQWSS